MNPRSSFLRLFVAIDAPEVVRASIGTLPERLRGVVWTPPHQYHLTLRFIGEIEPARLASIEQALTPIRVEPFILPVAGTGSFPPGRPPRVLWAGVGSGHPRLHQLRQRVDDALLACGLADLDVRVFHPHFTLGRCGAGCSPGAVAAFLKKHREFEAPPFRVEAFTLYQSTLEPGGAVHTPLLRVGLTPAT
jgi:2'-5' RNA ligase